MANKKTSKYVPSPHPHVVDDNPPKKARDDDEDLECNTCERRASRPECSVCEEGSTFTCNNCEETFCDDHINDSSEHSCMDCELHEAYTCNECGTNTGYECGQCDEPVCEDCENDHMVESHSDTTEIDEDRFKCEGCDENAEDCDCDPIEEDDKKIE